MKRQLLLLALTGFFFIPGFGQTLYTSTNLTGDTYNPGLGKNGTAVIMLDDISIPSIQVQGTDSISITKLKFGIARFATAPASTIKFYYSILDDTATSLRYVTKTPPKLLGSIDLPANGATDQAFLVNLGDSINPLFKIKTDTGNIYEGVQTFFLGLSFSGASDPDGLNNWLVTTPGAPQSDNENIWWEFDADASPVRAAYAFGAPPAPPGTFYLQVFGKGLSPLPVTFSQFTARRTGSINVLNWSTQQEINTSHFIIERSTDGSGYTNIGRVAAAGNSNNIRNYTFTDPRPVKGNNYYRVRTVDLDNSIKLSDTRRIRNEGIADISIYPNPVANLLSVAISADKATEGQLTVTDISGKALYSRIVKLPAGNTLLPVPLSNMAAGTYIIKVQLNDDVVIKKFVKQ